MSTTVDTKFKNTLDNNLELEAFASSLKDMIPKYIDKFEISNNELILITPSEYIVPTIYFLRDHTNTQYKGFVDICGVDYPNRKNRFEIIYNFLSFHFNARITVKTSVNDRTALNSITNVFKAANWFEREVWDLYGVFFKNHPDLRRILTDYGFEGHPLRKDFPLSGYVEVRYDPEKKRVVTEHVELSQEYRVFNFSSPWEQNN